MTEPIAFKSAKSLTVGEIAAQTGAPLRPSMPRDRLISGIAPLDTATSRDLSFLENPKYLDEFAQTRAGACLVTRRFADPPHLAALPVRDAYRAFVSIARTLFPDALRPSSLFAATAGGAVGASLHPSARLESSRRGRSGRRRRSGSRDRAGTVIAANAVIGPRVRVGRNCSIGAHSTIQHALIGDHPPRLPYWPGRFRLRDGAGRASEGAASRARHHPR